MCPRKVPSTFPKTWSWRCRPWYAILIWSTMNTITTLLYSNYGLTHTCVIPQPMWAASEVNNWHRSMGLDRALLITRCFNDGRLGYIYKRKACTAYLSGGTSTNVRVCTLLLKDSHLAHALQFHFAVSQCVNVNVISMTIQPEGCSSNVHSRMRLWIHPVRLLMPRTHASGHATPSPFYNRGWWYLEVR